jgi:hypothetical protein
MCVPISKIKIYKIKVESKTVTAIQTLHKC